MDYKSPRQCLAKSGATAESCHLSVEGVHHDKVQKEYSTSTVIVYLNDIASGGGTVWPCSMTYDFKELSGGGSVTGVVKGQPSDHCTSAFYQNARWYDGDKAVRYGTYKKHRVEKDLNAHLQEILVAAHYGCLEDTIAPSWVKTDAVRTVAKKGSAAVFFHDKLDLTPDDLTWHAGCLPISGDKWTMQKFKELPEKYRKEITYAAAPIKQQPQNDL